jgi:tetratricopeptide (TPR) repeat protein
MRKHLSLWMVGSAALLLPALAHAEDEPKTYPECTKTPTDAETAAAKGAYQAGNASFDEADYPRAITYWEDAYRRDCTANLLLKNLARAYELYGQKRQAVVALETFLVREPGSADKEQIQRRIEVLKKQIAAEKSTPAPPPVAGTGAPAPTHVATPEPQPGTETTTSSSSSVPLLPLFVAGGGGAVVLIGLAIYLPARKDVNDAEDKCPNRVCPGGPTQAADIKAGEDARKKATTGAVLTGVGAAAVAGGLIWYLAQPKQSTTTATLLHPDITPTVSPGFAGLALSGAF